MAVRPECPPAPTSAEHALSVSSLHHGRASTHPRSVGPPRRLYNRRCVGGRDTPGHDDLGKILVPQPLILMPMAMPDHNDMAPPVRQRITALGIPRLRENLGLLSLQDRRGLIRLAHERPVSRPLGPDASAGDDAPADAEYGAPADERAAAARRR